MVSKNISFCDLFKNIFINYNHLQSSQQNSTRRDPQFKIAFDIICGITDFQVHIFCPMKTKKPTDKHHEAGLAKQMPPASS